MVKNKYLGILKISGLLASIFLGLKFLSYMILTFIPMPLILFLIYGKYLILLIGCILAIRLFINRIGKEKYLQIFIAVIFFSSPFVVEVCFNYYKPTVKIYAYSDGVMGSTELEFFEGNRFRHVNSSILGDEIYKGTYLQSKDSLTIKYSTLPSNPLSSELLIQDKYIYCIDNYQRFYISESSGINW